MQKPLLISENTLKAHGMMEDNVDSKMVKNVTVAVQELQLKPVLGTDLYTSLLNDVYQKSQDPTYVIPDEHLELLTDYIQPFMIWSILADFLVINNYKISNKGVLKMSDDAAGNVSPDEINVPQSFCRQYAASYKDNLIDYLKKNSLEKPLNDDNSVSDATGWYLSPDIPYAFPSRFGYNMPVTDYNYASFFYYNI